MISLDDLPRDQDGVVQGAWRLVHQNPAYYGPLGHIEIQHGLAVTPAFGPRLSRLVAACGQEFYLEPWPVPYADGWDLPDGFRTAITAEQLARIPVAPWRAPSVQAPTLEEELARAAAEGIDAPPFSELRDQIAQLPLEGLRDAHEGLSEGVELARAKGFPAMAVEFEKLLVEIATRTKVLADEAVALQATRIERAKGWAAEMRAHSDPAYAAGCARREALTFRELGETALADELDAVGAELEAKVAALPKLDPAAPETPYIGGEALPGVTVPAGDPAILPDEDIARSATATVTPIADAPKPAPAPATEKPKGKPKAK